MAVRLSLEPEIVALLKAIQKRIDVLPGISTEKRNGVDVYLRGVDAFLQLEIRRDFLSLDIWLDDDQLEDARASGIARAHPFLGEDAIKVRFERATDLARVARWIEHSHGYAPRREERQKERAVERKVAEAAALERAEREAAQRAAEEAAQRAAEAEARRIADARAAEARLRAAHTYVEPSSKPNGASKSNGKPSAAKAMAAAKVGAKRGAKTAPTEPATPAKSTKASAPSKNSKAGAPTKAKAATPARAAAPAKASKAAGRASAPKPRAAANKAPARRAKAR